MNQNHKSSKQGKIKTKYGWEGNLKIKIDESSASESCVRAGHRDDLRLFAEKIADALGARSHHFERSELFELLEDVRDVAPTGPRLLEVFLKLFA